MFASGILKLHRLAAVGQGQYGETEHGGREWLRHGDNPCPAARRLTPNHFAREAPSRDSELVWHAARRNNINDLADYKLNVGRSAIALHGSRENYRMGPETKWLLEPLFMRDGIGSRRKWLGKTAAEKVADDIGIEHKAGHYQAHSSRKRRW